MPREPRSYVQTPYFHVMVQGINREFIFHELFKEANGDIEEIIEKKEEVNMELKEIIEDPVCLKELVHLLKVENEISFREIEKRIGIDRRILSKITQ